jgi:electron transport complex protein RnfA
MYLYYPWGILFAATLLLWIILARLLFFLGGIFDYMLVFPLSVLGSMALEKLFFYGHARLKKAPWANKLFRIKDMEETARVFSIGSSYSGLAAAALFLTLRFALSFTDAVMLSLAFSAGGLLAFIIIKEIQKRSLLEAIPYGLRGTPILLISMGLLSLVCSAASVLFLKIFL